MIISFDFQKNQVLPRVPDQSAYYSRQLYMYNLTILVGDSRCKQTKDNVFIYHYDETEHKKDSNAVSSAVYHFLNNLNVPNTVSVLRLMSDGCGGQNKNSTMMGMLSYWLFHNAPNSVKEIEYVFPVVGHSFLPPDRVFARIEKTIKKTPVITTPDEYINIFSQFGSIIPLADKVFDWKGRYPEVFKPPSDWHCKFNPSKRFHFKFNANKSNILLNAEVHYKTNLFKYKSICKKGEKVSFMVHPDQIMAGKHVSPLKLRDVSALLCKHFGNEWSEMEALQYYKNIIERCNNVNAHDIEEDEKEQDCLDKADEVEDLVV